MLSDHGLMRSPSAPGVGRLMETDGSVHRGAYRLVTASTTPHAVGAFALTVAGE